MGLNKRMPNSCSKKNQHQGPMYVHISSKKAIKNTVKELGRDTQNVAGGLGSSGHAAQLKWD